MRKFENNRRKNPYGSPYSVYKEKTDPINNKFIKNNNNVNNFKIYTMNANNESSKRNKYKNYEMNFSSDTINLQNLQNNYNINNNNSIQRMMSGSNIFGKSEITNPGYYLQKMNKDYYKYRMEQKRVLEYNRELMENKLHNKLKNEPDINPYNPIDNKVFELGKSDLVHNPILNPVNDYGYNKYLEKDSLKNNNYNIPYIYSTKNLGVIKTNNMDNNISSIINNNNLCYNRDYSTLQNAGNQLLSNT